MWSPPWIGSRLSGVTDTAAFRRWFGNSVVVNPDGTPKVVYHGTNATFTVFSLEAKRPIGKNIRVLGPGFYFATNPTQAKAYGDRVLPVYLRIERPRLQSPEGLLEPATDDQDGVIAHTFPGTRKGELVLLVKDPNQIKSVDNVGTFDPTNPDILMGVR